MSDAQHPAIPKTARAAIWVENNVLGIETVPVPGPGEGEVLVRMRACGICGSDLHAFHTAAPRRHIPGIGPGHELAGEVAALGPGVAGPKVGSRVAMFPGRVCDRCTFCRGGLVHLCPELRIAGGGYPGGMAEYFLAQAGYLFAIPDGMSWEVAALSEPCGISLHGLKRAGIRRGQNVLILGAGTIGLFAALIARDAGARRVGITARYPHQAAAARALGVTDVFDPVDVESGRPVAGESWDIVVESIGGSHQTLQPAINMARRGGTVLLLGVHNEPQTIQTGRVFFHEVSIVGAFGYDTVGPRSDYDEALAVLDRYRNEVARLVTHTYPLEEAARAFETSLDKRSGAIKVTVLL